ncbi:MAG: serine hydrolase [Bacteroidota bacterium]
MKAAILWLFLCTAILLSHSQDMQAATILDEMIKTGMQDWNVPGLAAVVVKEGEVVFKKTYGVKSIVSQAAVDGETLFAMASTTKAMVAMALGILVDEGKLHWEDRVVDHFPDFHLSDSYITVNARVKYLLTHNLGIANADVLWTLDSLSTKETLHRFKFTEDIYPLRGGFTYQNIMYAAAGEVIARVSGIPWHQFVQERLFDPLNMKRSQTKALDILEAGNYVDAHYDFEKEGVQVVDRNYSDQIGAAGMMWSCLDDMAKYLKFIVNQGRVNNDTLVQPKTFKTLFQPHTLIPEHQFYPTISLTRPNWLSYGLGWFQHDYRGYKLDFHTGSLQGLVAIAGVMHDKNTAVYVFANLDHAELRHAILYQAMDLFAFEDVSTNWHPKVFERYQDLKKERNGQLEQQVKQRVPNTTPSLELKAYAGNYHHPLCGQLSITIENDMLLLNFNTFQTVSAKHWHHDTFRTVTNRRWTSPQLIRFQLNNTAHVDTVTFWGYSFEKSD